MRPAKRRTRRGSPAGALARTARQRFTGIAWFIFVLALVAGMFTVAFFLTNYIYKIANLKPALLVSEFINSLLGLLFTGMIVGGVGKLARARGWVPEMNLFGPIIEAMERMAAGDFSVRLENQYQDNPMVNELTNSVNKMAVELDQIENLRQEFVSNVSHEIQSPLTSIRGFAQALENEQLSPDEKRRYLGIIQAESARLSRITEDLLRLTSLEAESAKFEPRPYRLDKQIRDLILACEPQWVAKGIDMQVRLDEISITADEDLLSQVWTNLLHNSIKFTPQGGKVCVELGQQSDQIEFKISDSGAGISAEDQARVFERFFKADKARTRSNGGSGLGLSIVKKIVEMHKGNIELESQPEEGAIFTIYLPAKQESCDE
jgi:two-component system, OmpR family, phosphate regulon sensor histidine kinase PhoR